MRDLGITFAGGGNRAFYQLGLLNRWAGMLHPRIAAMACCSAGACVATIWLSGRKDEVNVFWKNRRSGVTKNFEWGNLLRGRRPTPHAPIYRDTLIHAFSDGGLDRIRRQPFPIYVLTAGFPRLIPSAAAVVVGMSAYTLEKALRKEMIHPSWGRKLGFQPRVFDARACRTPEELADLIIASSSTPPFTPVGRISGDALLDGGIIDNVPADWCEQSPEVQRNLVLLTRPYPAHVLGSRRNRLYLAPTKPTPVNRWDYTRPELVDATIEMGEQEALLHERELLNFLS